VLKLATSYSEHLGQKRLMGQGRVLLLESFHAHTADTASCVRLGITTEVSLLTELPVYENPTDQTGKVSQICVSGAQSDSKRGLAEAIQPMKFIA